MNRQKQAALRDLNYYYSFNVAALAPGVTTQKSINIDADSRFHWLKTAYFADVAAAAQTDSTRIIPLITVQLTDTGSGRQFFDQPIPVPSIAGPGELPAILPLVQIFEPNATLKAEFTNFDAAATYNLRVMLIGFKKYS